jgi:uncharacterized membrane protein
VAAANRLDRDGGLEPNAVRVTKTITTPGFFAGIFGSDAARITAAATAARIPSVSFSLGSGLADLSAGDINRILGKMLGADLSLSLIDYEGLASANVDALGMLNQLAVETGLDAGTYGELADATVTLGQLLAAARARLEAQPGGQNSAALQAINLLSLQAPPGISARLGALMDMTLWQDRRIGSIVEKGSGGAAINLFDTVRAMARLYGAGHLVDLGSALSIPVVGSSVSAYLSAGEPVAGMTTGTVGSRLATSQMRLALSVTVANVDLGIAKATVRVPVYVQMASASAVVTAIPCQPERMATITAAPVATWARIGDVDTGSLSDYGSDPIPQQADIVSLTILGIPVEIGAVGVASVAAGPPQALNFRQADIAEGVVKSASADADHLLSELAGDIVLDVRGNGVSGVVQNILSGIVMPLLRPTLISVLSSLDPLVYRLLQTAGLRLGTAGVGVHKVNCGHPTIVG